MSREVTAETSRRQKAAATVELFAQTVHNFQSSYPHNRQHRSDATIEETNRLSDSERSNYQLLYLVWFMD